MSGMTETGTKRYKLKEVCIRLAEGHPLYSDVPLSSPTVALDVMRKELSQYDREILCVVNLNNKLKPINFNIVSMGSINGSVAAIPNILKSGILSNAAGFLLMHNHPSGDVTPSKEDITTTRRCVEAGKLMDIPCLDHVIVGGSNGDMFSFRESGTVDFTSDKISMTAEQILHVNESNATYKGGTETMPENGRKDDQFVPDFVKEAEDQIAKGVKLPTQEEVTIKFGKGLAEPFQSKDGREFLRISIPNQDPADKTPWASFVLPAKAVHENQYGKGLWAKIPADGSTVVTKPTLQGQDAAGKNIWQDVKTQVPNTELKAMVESYKTRASQEKAVEHRESARDKLDALAKETATKVSPEKAKAKSKTKKGPEL